MISPARDVALDILLRVQREGAFASELLHSSRLDALSSADRGLCMELVMGVLRWRARIDFTLSTVSSQPLRKLDPEVLNALRLAAYQIGFLARIPAHAAVNDSVELVKNKKKRSAAPFVNAVLRKLASRKTLFDPPMVPGPKTVIDLAQLYAHPLWLVERWAAVYGLPNTGKICAYDQQVPQTCVRLHDPAAEKELAAAGVKLEPGVLIRSAQRAVSGDVTQTHAFAQHRVSIQDEASQLVALLVGRGRRLLDCCAAPGGKTAILAESNPQSEVVAAEVHDHRAKAMQERLAARKLTNVKVKTADAAALPPEGNFDRVLVDVPCSGTGTLARNPEIKWRLAAEDLADLHARQVAILKSALRQLGPGGQLIYSSCSLEPEENVEVVKEALAEGFAIGDIREELRRLKGEGELTADIDQLLNGPYLRTLPGVWPCDGFFAAVIKRS